VKPVDPLTATVPELERWILEETHADPRMLLKAEFDTDPPIYERELRNFVSDVLADMAEERRGLD
jgi:hypothetical protein